MSTGNHRRISPEEVQNVKNQIEQCLWNYMNKKQAMDILYQKQNIEPIFTKLVWERLEEENQDFFKTYYLKLALKNQITQFNDLLYQQAVADLNQANNPHGVACNGSHLHGSNFGFHQGVNHNNVPENVAVKAENMQQYNFPAVVQGGLNGGGPFVQSVMQNGPVNMAVGTQNGNGVAVGGPEGYFGNSRFFYQATHVNGNVNGNGNGMESHHDVSSFGNNGNGMESHHDVSSFGNADSIPVSYRLNGTVMDEAHSSRQLLRQFGQPESRGENSRVGNISRNFDFQNFGRDS
ncbi:hypothetical protein Lser_V15G06386 [Lactuca serriola]